MFELSVSWWELPLRALIVYVALLVMLRLSGKRTIGQFSPFDVIVVLLLSEAAQGALTANDTSVTGGLILVATLILLNFITAFISTRSRRAESLIEGDPVVLVRDGKVRDAALRKNNIPHGDLEEAMRRSGILQRDEVQLAVLEPDGSISFFSRK